MIVCQLFINVSVLFSSYHTRVEEQLVPVPSKRGFQFAEVLNPLLLAQH